MAPRNPRRRAFTLIELLVVIAIIAILMALLVPAVQKVRNAAARAQCQNSLKQLAIAAHSYENQRRTFPPGLEQFKNPGFMGSSVFAHLLPFFEQEALASQWDFTKPSNNTSGGTAALSAAVIPLLVCPADLLQQNPVNYKGTYYGATSYGGNGGTRSYYPSSSTADGMFFTTGPNSAPKANQSPVKITQVRDGTSNTLFFGERFHFDPNFDTFSTEGGSPVAYTDPLYNWAWWGPSGGFVGIGDITMSAYVPINYTHPCTEETKATDCTPAITSTKSTFFPWQDKRLCAFGSGHGGGANFALADGSVRFINEGIELLTLQALSTRSGGEVVKDY